jgi:hypothetical protein
MDSNEKRKKLQLIPNVLLHAVLVLLLLVKGRMEGAQPKESNPQQQRQSTQTNKQIQILIHFFHM